MQQCIDQGNVRKTLRFSIMLRIVACKNAYKHLITKNRAVDGYNNVCMEINKVDPALAGKVYNDLC